jgi:hypothetical protein
MDTKLIECPYCECSIKIDAAWVRKNGRAFCEHCCKSFECILPEKDEEKKNDDWDWGY